MKNISIKHLDKSERPREKLLERGAGALSDAELLAILLRSGSKETSAISLASEILKKIGGTEFLLNISYETLLSIKGIGIAKALTIVAALELAKRSKLQQTRLKKITSSQGAMEYILQKIGYANREIFLVFFLNNRLEILGEKEITRGGSSALFIEPKWIFHEALKYPAHSLLIAHNHPSGSLEPSQADLRITEKIKRIGEVLEIKLIDHILVSKNGGFSFAERGFL